MDKKTVTWLVIATFLLLIGCVIFGGVMAMLKWDFTSLSTIKYETNNYEISENYKNISIITDTADIVFIPSKDEKTSVVCYEQKKVKHSVLVKDETLTMEIKDTRKWYEYVGVSFGSPKITVCIPQNEYGNLSVKSSTGSVVTPKDFKFGDVDIKAGTGDIKVENAAANTLNLSVSTGKITVSNAICEKDVKLKVSTGETDLTNIKCKDFASSGNTGNINLNNVIATEKFTIKRSTGDIRFESLDAAEIFIETDTGDVIGTVLTDKVFIAQTDTGRVDVPKTVTGGRCEITTDTGDIRIKIQ